MRFGNRADWTGAWKICNWRGRSMLLVEAVKWYLWQRWQRLSPVEREAYYDQVLNPTGATCPCARSISVWCTECEGNRR